MSWSILIWGAALCHLPQGRLWFLPLCLLWKKIQSSSEPDHPYQHEGDLHNLLRCLNYCSEYFPSALEIQSHYHQRAVHGNKVTGLGGAEMTSSHILLLNKEKVIRAWSLIRTISIWRAHCKFSLNTFYILLWTDFFFGLRNCWTLELKEHNCFHYVSFTHSFIPQILIQCLCNRDSVSILCKLCCYIQRNQCYMSCKLRTNNMRSRIRQSLQKWSL